MSFDQYNSGDIVRLVYTNFKGAIVEGILIKPINSNPRSTYYILNKTSGSTDTSMLTRFGEFEPSYKIIEQYCEKYPRAFSFCNKKGIKLILVKPTLDNIVIQILNELT